MKKQPLSPHIQVYRWLITSSMSIGHRAASVASIYLGALGLMYVWCLALGKTAFSIYIYAATSWPGKAIISLLVIGSIFHFFTGLRYVVWERGEGFTRRFVYRSANAAIILTILCAVLVLKYIWS